MRKEHGNIRDIQTFYEKKLEFIMSGLSYNSFSEGVFKNLNEVNDTLDKIREEVKTNLLKKQENCSRLCFMGYESLIIFLREMVKRKTLNISQLFPGLDTIDISENAIYSVKRAKYQLDLPRPVTLFMANKALTLDTWVQDLEVTLVATFKQRILKINIEDDIWWESEKDIQILITAELIYFSSNISNPKLPTKLESTLSSVIACIKSGSQYLERLATLLICQLSLLTSLKSDPLIWDFTLKYSTSPVLRLCFMNSSIDFCYEFYNMSEFSYIPTPVTEKLMLHIVNSVVTHQTILLSGRSNVGKTSTLKEVALYCGKGICFWTSVSESSLNVLMSIVSGCACGGFWGVIEEIHNVEISILSTVLYYLTDIVQRVNANQVKIMISERLLRVKQGFGIFFTSSSEHKIPPYLSQNLRTVSIIQPDLQQVLLIKLEALGHSPHYAQQITAVFHLLASSLASTESLTPNTFSISGFLQALGALFSYFPRELTDSSVVSAFHQMYAMVLSSGGITALSDILASVFPNCEHPQRATSRPEIFAKHGLIGSKELQQQCEMLLNMLRSQLRWLIVTGPACSGKSALIGVAAQEYSQEIKKAFLVHKLSGVDSATLLKLVSICERAGETKYSYCSYPVGEAEAPTGRDWVVMDSRMDLDWDTLNYISKGEIFLNASRRVTVPKELKLFIECENLQGLTPGNLKNCTIVNISEEYISPSSVFKSMLQTMGMGDLADIYMPIYEGLVKAVYHGLSSTYFNYSLKIWTLQLLRLVSKMVKEARSLLSRKYDSLHSQIYKSRKPPTKKNPLGTSTMANAIVISDMYNPQHVDKKGEIILNTIEFLTLSRTPPVINTKSMFEGIFLCAIIYTLGTCTKDKSKFHRVFLDYLSRQDEDFAGGIRLKISVKSVFDLCYVIESQEWMEWGEDLVRNRKSMIKRKLTLRKSTRALIEVTKSLDSLYIPTDGSQRYVYWLSYFLNSGISCVILGPHQCGKTLLSTTILKKQLSQGYIGYLPISLTSSTKISNIQGIICTSLDQVKEQYYSCVGGIKQFVYIDDLNLDRTNSIYELLRFWKENHGWYNKEFTFIGQMEVLAVHGYSANRDLYSRALRHFNILYKEPYSAQDISAIFRNTVDSDIASVGNSRDELYSVFDMTVDFYKKLYRKVKEVNTDRYGCNLSMDAFMMALRKIADLQFLDTLETEEYIRVFRYIFNTYIADQVPKEFKELSEIMENSYLGFLAEFHAEITDDLSVNFDNILIDPSLVSETVSDYVLLTKELLINVIENFDNSVDKAKSSKFDEMKALHYLFNKPEETLGKYVLTYMRLLFDLKDRSNCTLICSDNSNKAVKSLVFAAAESLSMQVYNFTQSQDHAKDISAMGEFYLPVEAKFMLREVVNTAGIEDKPVIVLLETQENCSDLYILTILEIFNDIFSASAFKLPVCYKYYSNLMLKLQKNGVELKNLHNEQVLMSALEKIKANVKVVIVTETSSDMGTGNEKIGILETIKHGCRTLFNSSKIICYDHLSVPFKILEGIIIQDRVLNKWLNQNNRSIYTDFYEMFMKITGKRAFNDYQIEKMSYLTNEIKIVNDKRINKKINKLKVALIRIDDIEVEIESFREKVESIVVEIERLKAELYDLSERKDLYIAKNQTLQNSSYVPPFVEEFEQDKQKFLMILDKARSDFEESRDSLLAGKGEFAELSSINIPQPGLLLCAAYLNYLTMPKVRFPQNITLELIEPIAKPFLNNLTFGFNTITKKIRKIQIESLSLLEEVHVHPLLTTYNGPKGIKAYRLLYRFIDFMMKYKRVHDDYLELKQEWAKTEELLPMQAREAIEEASSELLIKLSEITESISVIEDRISSLQSTHENIEKIRPRAQQIIRSLNQKKLKWQEHISRLELTQSNLFSNAVFISFQVLVIFSIPNPIRSQLLENAANLIQSRDSAFAGIPKFPSQSFSHLLDLQLLGEDCKGSHVQSSSSFFQQIVAGIKAVFNFDLPYPLIVDPYNVFKDFVSIEEGDELTLITLDAGFEEVLDKIMEGGRAALIVNPSTAMYKAINILITTRIQYFLCKSRGLPYEDLNIRIANQFIKFNPSFRLYICCDFLNSEETELFTVFSMEMDGIEWKNMLLSKIQKQLDTMEYSSKAETLKSTFATKDQTLVDDKEAIRLLQGDIKSQTSIDFFDLLHNIWKILHIQEFDIPKLQKSMIKDEPEDCPDFQNLLEELYRFHRILSFTNHLTRPYIIHPSTLVDMILDSVRELSHNSPDFALSHLAASLDVMLYILLCWIHSSMPAASGLVFVMYFAMSKYVDTSPEYTDEIAQVFKDAFDGKSASAAEVAQELQAKYPNLMPPGFTAGTILHLESCEMYKDSRMPKNIPSSIKLLIYARMRVDLIPFASYDMLTELMGYRYSFLATPSFYKIALFSKAARPVLVIYEEKSPINWIVTECQIMSVKLQVFQPLLKVAQSTSRRETLQINCRAIIMALLERAAFPKWIVIENANVINPNEVESLMRAIVQAVGDPLFKVLLLVSGKIEDCSHLTPIIDICYRVYIKKPETVKERITDWLCWYNPEYYTRYRTEMLEKYRYHLTSNPTATSKLFSKKANRGKGPLRKLSSALLFTNQITSIISFGTSEGSTEIDVMQQLPYNVSLFTALLHLRKKFTKERIMNYSDTRHLLQDLIPYLGTVSRPKQLAAVLKFFRNFWEDAQCQILDTIFLSFNSISVVVDGKNVVYPLYGATKKEGFEAINTLVELMTIEDHLKVVGLDHQCMRQKLLKRGKKTLELIPEFLQMMKPMVLSLSLRKKIDISRQTQ